MKKRILLVTICIFFLPTLVGCIYSPPLKVSISNLIDTPSLYKNKKVEISGYVVRNEYYGEKFVTWQLIMEENGKRIYCYENGYNTDVITKCVSLAEEAKKNNEKIIVTGRLREGGYRDIASDDTILELKTFEYKDYKIDTDYERDKWLHPAHDTFDLHNSYGH
ncbi:MAG: hypothetical protein ACYST3_00750 [Planctomycetota bacterium]|jgi:hypothetical protein